MAEDNELLFIRNNFLIKINDNIIYMSGIKRI